MCSRSKFRIIIPVCNRIVEKSETVFHTDNTCCGIVDTAHGHFAFLHKFFEQRAIVKAIRLHCHIYTGIYRHFYGFLFVGSHMLARIQVVDVCPVRDYYAVPVQALF